MTKEYAYAYEAGYLDGYSARESEIVRCRDCIYYADDEMEFYHYCNRGCEQVEPDGFCACGERRGE